MKNRFLLKRAGLLIVLAAPLLPFEKQLTLSTYHDSNPVESLANPEAVWGLKAQQRFSYNHVGKHWNTDGLFVGQGFLEPNLLLDSKLVGNAILNLRKNLTSRFMFITGLTSFQKLYLRELDHSSRSSVNMWLEHDGMSGRLQRVGFEMSRAQVNSGRLYRSSDRRASLLFRRVLRPGLLAELSLAGGLTSFDDIPARSLIEGVVLNRDEDQQDRYALITLHLKHTGQMIWGLSFSRQLIDSNSALAEASVWLAKLYLSRRFGSDVYLHLVVQGMDKNYGQTLYTATTPNRDPEETIQNQVHIQLERVLNPSRVVFLQYSYSRNETIYNYWFYDKQLLECGLKLSF